MQAAARNKGTKKEPGYNHICSPFPDHRQHISMYLQLEERAVESQWQTYLSIL